MRYTRKFLFEPSWESRGYSWCTADDLYEIPPFNRIAEFLNYRGWQIDSFRYIEDTYPHCTTYEMKSIELYCSKDVERFREEPTYEYTSTGECELSYYDQKVGNRKTIRI